jgi:quercetin dioxygenase-like cupin family protein
MPLPPYYSKVSDMPAEHRFENASGESTYHRTGMVSEHGMICWVRLTSGFTMEKMAPDKHFHENDMIIYVISGRCTMTLYGKDDYVMEEDSAIYVPPNAPHYLELIDDQPCYILELFAPKLNHYLYTAEHQTAAVAPPRQADGSRDKGWDMADMVAMAGPKGQIAEGAVGRER